MFTIPELKNHKIFLNDINLPGFTIFQILQITDDDRVILGEITDELVYTTQHNSTILFTRYF